MYKLAFQERGRCSAQLDWEVEAKPTELVEIVETEPATSVRVAGEKYFSLPRVVVSNQNRGIGQGIRDRGWR
jgi:hypothetical protein